MEGYTILPNGLIKQNKIFSNIQSYDKEYIETRYNSYGEKGLQMAYLRLGFILGVLKTTPNSILDVGYGNGDFLKVCSQTIPLCYGNDISGYPLPPKVNFIENIFENHYNVITFFDCLEHFENIDFVSNLKCDYIVVSVPCCHFFSEEWFINWKHRRPDEHFYHFGKESIVRYFNEMGFKQILQTNIEDIIRTPIDSYQNILTCVFKNIK
jgi:hypothetical protein